MVDVKELITDNIDVWTGAIKKRNATGRGASNKIELTGINKLRELILELAVRGKLVPQNASDEPASVLLTRIADEKAQLIADKKIKKTKQLPAITDEEKPFELPSGWEWARLGQVCRKVTDGSHNPPKNAGEGFPMLSSQNVNFDKIDFTTPSRYVTEADFHKEDKRTSIEPNDILLNIVASIGRSAVVPKDAPKFVLQRSVAVLASQLASNFFSKQLVSPLCLSYYDAHAKGTAQKGIYLGKLSLMPLSIPPLAEQHRIVAKVDELMALCDQLEQQTEQNLTAHQTLVEALLETLTDCDSSEEFQTNWQRIAEHFDVLFTTEHSIEQLKQTILQLAVMGKLVPQNSSDEPASVLLERIAAEKAQLIADKKIKKQKSLPAITDDEKPFELPSGWEWNKLGNLSSDIHYGYTASAKYDCDGVRLLRITDIQNDKVNWHKVPACDISPVKVQSYLLVNNDILIARTGGTIGKSYLVENIALQAVFASYLIRVKRISAMYASFIKTYLGSQLYWCQLYDNASGTGQPNVNATALKNLAIPIPPLAEQHRIVAKVDELMVLCEQLKACLNDAQTTQLHLADAVIANTLN